MEPEEPVSLSRSSNSRRRSTPRTRTAAATSRGRVRPRLPRPDAQCRRRAPPPLFAKIDVDADERIDWDEFSAYVLSDQAREVREASTGSHYLPARNQRVLFDSQTRHKDLLTRVVHPQDGSVCERLPGGISARGITSTRIPAFAMHKRINCGGAYLTDAALLPATSRLAVASFDRRVRVYETKGWTAGSYRSFDFAPLCCAAWEGGRHRRTLQGADHHVVGDDGGLLHALTVIDMTDGEKAENPDASVKFERRWRVKAHDDWVNGVCHMDREDAVGSCGADKTVRVTDIERAQSRRFAGGITRRCTPSLGAVAGRASTRRRRLRRAGVDPAVQRPRVEPDGPRGVRVRHPRAPAGEPDPHLDLSKTVKVWDIRTNRCLQTFSDEQSYHPENRLRLALGPRAPARLRKRQPKTWRLVSRDVFVRKGHNTRSCSRDTARVSIRWSPRTSPGWCARGRLRRARWVSIRRRGGGGRRRRQTARALADESRPNPRADDVDGDDDANAAPRLTCASFDTHGRRLVTGSSRREVSRVEFRKRPPRPSAQLRTPTASPRWRTSAGTNRRFVGVGWNRLVTLWEDDGGGRTGCHPGVFSAGRADVLCLARSERVAARHRRPPGAVFVWTENGALRHRLEPPPLPADGDVRGRGPRRKRRRLRGVRGSIRGRCFRA